METRLFKEIPPCVTDIELVRGGRELIGEGEASSLRLLKSPMSITPVYGFFNSVINRSDDVVSSSEVTSTRVVIFNAD